MVRILLRAGKSPFSTVSPATVFWDDLIAKNSGNLLFAHAAYKMLSAPDVEIDVTGYRNPPAAEADEINEKYDKFVIPLANAFRDEFEPQLKALTALIRKLKIPVVVVGVGAQAEIGASPAGATRLEETAKNFLSAVLDRSASIGVRGAFTAEYIRSLGFDAVKVIGCPSMFLYGERVSVSKRASHIHEGSNIAVNLTGNMPTNIDPLINKVFNDYGNATYIAQNRQDLAMLLWNQPAKKQDVKDCFPRHPEHPAIASGRARFFTDVSPWIEFLKPRDFSFGTRIHGNIFAILAGTPGFVIAHDSRTLELAEYFDIPHRKIGEINADTTVAELYAEADYSRLCEGHAERFLNYRAFLEANDINHIFQHVGAADAFETRLATIYFPGEIAPLHTVDAATAARRTSDLAEVSLRHAASLSAALAAERKKKVNAANKRDMADSTQTSTPQPTSSTDAKKPKKKSHWWQFN